MTLLGFTVEWMAKGLRPNYRRDRFVGVVRWRHNQWYSLWFGDRIRIGKVRVDG